VVKARPFHLRLFVGDKTKFDDPQGLAVARLDSWDDPSTTKDDDEVTVYGVNSGQNCLIFNRSMYSLGIYGLAPGEETFDAPWGVAADRHGKVFVTDRGSGRVIQLQNDGESLRFVRSIGSPGTGHGQFVDPRGIALLPDGSILVADAGLGRVIRFDSTGTFEEDWDGFTAPTAVAAVGRGEAYSYYPGESFAIVIDSLDRRVRKLSLDGKLLGESIAMRWGAPLTPDLTFVTLDYHNNVIITDRKNGSLHKLDHNLEYLTRFGETGDDDNQFDQPRGIAINRQLGQLFIAEREGAQYFFVGVDISDFRATVKADSTWRDLNIDFRLTEPALIDIDVTDIYGQFIARLVERRRYGSGNNHLAWGLVVPNQMPDGKPIPTLPVGCRAGERVPSGEYRLKARIRAVYSSREAFSKEASASFKVDWLKK
jgi:hypothetical protein